MNDKYNTAEPLMMHVDLNSAFATTEQQSRPRLRGRPVVIVNRLVENTAIITASYEAKAMGVKVGMKYKEAKRLIPNIVALESDPAKYRYVYKKLMGIMNDYSPNVVMKSIDEGVMDFNGLAVNRPLVDIGHEIKQRLKDEVGCVMRCNIGIGTSRFMAKTAAGLHKPDGLDVINYENLRSTYEKMKLTDITGIAEHLQKRLNAVGIFTPLEFLDTSVIALEKIVFKSICGGQWHQRLRGFEVDDIQTKTKTIGRQYVLENRNLKKSEIADRLHNLCESVGARMRAQNLTARGIFVYVRTIDRQYWHKSQMCQMAFFSDLTINTLAQQIFSKSPDNIMEIGVRLYELSVDDGGQVSLFNDVLVREQQLVKAVDDINIRFGERKIHSASTINTDLVKVKVPFGSIRYL